MKKISQLFVLLFLITTAYAQNETDGFTDKRDKKTYKTVKIGTQVWMAEDLAYKASSGCWTYVIGKDSITFGVDSIKKTIIRDKYGYLYNWETASEVCPSGWHLPNKDEVNILVDYLGGTKEAGEKLKSINGWPLKKGENYGNNESGFNALPGGFFDNNTQIVDKYEKSAKWWLSNTSGLKNAWFFAVRYSTKKVIINNAQGRNHGNTVRCIKD